MIKKIFFAVIFLCLIVAIPLYIAGVRQVEVGGPFMAFLRTCNNELNQFKFAIPDIPKIPTPMEEGFWWDVLKVLISIANFIGSIGNVAIMITNTIIQLVQFIYIMIRNVIALKDNLESHAITSSSSPFTVYSV